MQVPKVSAATATLTINDFQASVGSTRVVPINANITEGDLSEFAITITYDEAVVDVLANENITLNPLFTGTVFADAGANTSTIIASTNSPVTGIVKLADVRFTTTGASGSATTVTVTPDSGSFLDSMQAQFTPEPLPDTAAVTVVDITPNPFSIPNQSDVPLSTLIESAPVTITGIDTPANISINNGAEYKINDGAYTSLAGTVSNNDLVTVRMMSSDQYSTEVSTFLRVGTGGDDFKITTMSDPAIDTIPDSFTFINQADVPLSTAIDSAPITILGINTPAPISVSGGEYSINGGVFTSAAGTVSVNDTVAVRLMSSPTFSTTTSAVLSVGGISDDFSVTTIGAPDGNPDPFTFIDQTDVALNTEIDSNSITVTGITAAATISISGGQYSINGGGFTTEVGTVNANDVVMVRLLSSTENATSTSAILTIADVSDEFTVTTIAAPDTTPDAFTFVDQVDVPVGSEIISTPITVSGINSPAAITVTGGEYSIDGGAFTVDPGTVLNGQQVTVKQTSSASFNTTTDTTLNIGGVTDTFSVTTVGEPGDTVPNPFVFIDQTDVTPNTQLESNAITVSGITSPAPISITGGEYAIDGGTFTSLEGTVSGGESIVVRQTSSADFATSTDTILTIGGVSDTFTLTTTTQDTTPDQFTFTDQIDVLPNASVDSNQIIVSGINSPAPITISGGLYSINGAGLTSDPGTVNEGDSVIVSVISSGSFSTPVTATLTIGGVSDDFTVTTAAEDTTPDQFTFVDQTDVMPNSQIESEPITVSGITSPVSISIVGGEYSVNGAAFTSADATVNNSDTVVVRLTSSTEFSTSATATLTIGGISDDFTVTTVAEPINGAPVLANITEQAVQVNTPLVFTASATDPESDTLSFSLSGEPAGATIDSASGLFNWTPTETGTFTFEIFVSDGVLTDSQTVTVIVSAAPVVPPVVIPVTPAQSSEDDDSCGDQCEKYKEYKWKYKTSENKRIYETLKTMKKNDPAAFASLQTIYINYRDWSDNERERMLSPQVISQFRLYKAYNGYKHYRNLKDRLDK